MLRGTFCPRTTCPGVYLVLDNGMVTDRHRLTKCDSVGLACEHDLVWHTHTHPIIAFGSGNDRDETYLLLGCICFALH